MDCMFCGKEIQHPIQKKSKNHFCNSSCAASYNNTIAPKRVRNIRYCNLCGRIIDSRTRLRCDDCVDLKQTSGLIKETTIGQIKELYKDKTHLNFAAKIRGYGKTAYDRSDRSKHCAMCGYNRHYEVCHIKAVKDFDDTATMEEVHNLDNLIALCPNCHWEFDHGILKIGGR